MIERRPERIPRDPQCRIAEVVLDEASVARAMPDAEHERIVAIYDLVEDNYCQIPDGPPGPYKLRLGLAQNRLVLDMHDAAGSTSLCVHLLSLTSLRRIIRDYFIVCESYYSAIRTATPEQIEAIDMGRRSLHNEGAQILLERLTGKIVVDFDTARRLFTLITALHWKG